MNKGRGWKILAIALIFINIVLILLTISIRTNQKEYIDQDKEQFIYELNNSIIRSKVEIDNIVLRNSGSSMDKKDLKILMIHHENLERNIYGYKNKSRLINSELYDGFQELWYSYHSFDPISEKDIRLYYEDLSKRIDGKEYILLNEDDVHMLQEILNFYNIIRKEINNLIG